METHDNTKYLKKYLWNRGIKIYEINKKVSEEIKQMLNYDFGIPLKNLDGKKYQEISNLLKNSKPSELEKDLDQETEDILGKN